jgi:cyclase
MTNYRVIPCLLLSNGGLVKTKKFKNSVYVGDPLNAIRIFNEKEVDELVLLDIRASLDKRGPNYDLLKEIASECFMPLAYGGGITSLDQIKTLLRIGVEKIILNTALFRDPCFVIEAVATFGSQAVIASLDVKKKLFGRREVMTLGGAKASGLTPVEAAQRVEKLGVGEILLTSIDAEGTMEGYDLDLLAEVSKSVNVPIIASGGAGKLEDFYSAIRFGHVSAVAAGSMFVFYGRQRAVLINYPQYNEVLNLFKHEKL